MNKQIKASLQALCDLQYLLWSTLGRSIFRGILGTYDERLFMPWSFIGKHCGLTGGSSFTNVRFSCHFVFFPFL
ncbi:hypothetical protein U1Q18_006642 [Sarracenia purpurea var. burkii]